MRIRLPAAMVALFSYANVALAQTELPFVVGERLHYRVSVGKLGTVGEGMMSVDGPVDVRGIPTLVLRSEVKAHVAFLKSDERAESWIDPTRMAVLRYQKKGRGPLARGDVNVEVFPDSLRWEDGHGNIGELPTDAPLDELSFIYFIRTLPLISDSTLSFSRHFDAQRSPTTVRVLGHEQIATATGSVGATVVEMRVRDPEHYRGEGTIRFSISEDRCRIPMRIESTIPDAGTVVLTLANAGGDSLCTARLAGR